MLNSLGRTQLYTIICLPIKLQESRYQVHPYLLKIYRYTYTYYTRKLGAFHVTIELDEIELGLSQLCLNSFEKSWSITLHCAELRAAEFFLKKKIALPFHHMHIITYTGVLVCDLLNVLLQMVKVDFFLVWTLPSYYHHNLPCLLGGSQDCK